MKHRVMLRLAFSTIGLAAFLLAADPAWKTKPIAQWTEADAKQLLVSSPWSRTFRSPVARAKTEDELRDGGKMGQPQGVGYQGVPNKQPALADVSKGVFAPGDTGTTYVAPMVQLQLRWESALPVRMAELKSPDNALDSAADRGYTVAVWGLPGGFFEGDPKKLGEPLKKLAFLKRQGKKDVLPISAEVYSRPECVVVVYVFPASAEISPKDGVVTVEAHIGRIGFSLPFNLSEMGYQGKLEL